MGIAERREREKEQRRNDIIDAAEKIFFTRGLEAATMDEVAEAAELAKATLYLYFHSKEELFAAILLRGCVVLHDMFASAVSGAGTGLAKVEAIGRAYIEFFRKHTDYFHTMIHFEAKVDTAATGNDYAVQCDAQRAQTMSLVAQAVQAGIDDGSIRRDLDPVRMSVILWAQTTGLLQILAIKSQAIREQYQIDPEQVIEDYFAFVERSMRAAQ